MRKRANLSLCSPWNAGTLTGITDHEETFQRKTQPTRPDRHWYRRYHGLAVVVLDLVSTVQAGGDRAQNQRRPAGDRKDQKSGPRSRPGARRAEGGH